LTFTYLLRYVEDPGATLAELARVVRPGGRIASLEFAVPPRAAWRLAWRFYTHIGLPLLGRLVSREWAHTGRFLAKSIPDFYKHHPIERVVELWERAGIADIGVRSMSLGGGVVMWGTKQALPPAEPDAVAAAASARATTTDMTTTTAAAGKASTDGDTEPA
ncbi:MAG TPA: class I SAM-dependent methyltransferase, partial [Solirubrobacteraceae bacterium]|nr:class I SAM-dependent methyltransferase [Solirubrobacteraceae bacterium]